MQVGRSTPAINLLTKWRTGLFETLLHLDCASSGVRDSSVETQSPSHRRVNRTGISSTTGEDKND